MFAEADLRKAQQMVLGRLGENAGAIKDALQSTDQGEPIIHQDRAAKFQQAYREATVQAKIQFFTEEGLAKSLAEDKVVGGYVRPGGIRAKLVKEGGISQAEAGNDQAILGKFTAGDAKFMGILKEEVARVSQDKGYKAVEVWTDDRLKAIRDSETARDEWGIKDKLKWIETLDKTDNAASWGAFN